MLTTRRCRTAAALLALLLANLALVVGLWRSGESRGVLGYSLFIAIGIPLSQILLLAAWLSWAEGTWVIRLGAAIPLAAGIGAAVVLGDSFEPPAALGALPAPAASRPA